jgi:osmotically-inducible protein OsmY
MFHLTDSREQTHDRDLERRVLNYLISRHIPASRVLEVEAENGVVTVRGKVKTFYQKQVCAHTCRRVAGVNQLIDAIEVGAA